MGDLQIAANYQSIMISFNPSNDTDLKWYQYIIYAQGQIVQSGLEYIPVNENSYFLQGYSVSNVFTVDVQDNSSATPNFDGTTTTNNVVYYAKVRSIDTSGNASTWTSIVSSAATRLIQSSHIANLTAGKITSGTINAAEITLNGATSILQSSNYQQGLLGWKITGFGDAEFNNLIIRTALDIGGSDTSSFHVDIDGNLWLGAGTYATAPFRISNTGNVDVGGTDTSSFHIDKDGNIWSGAGTFNVSTNPFSVTAAGALRAASANITGVINASSGTFSGTILSGVNNTTQFGNNINGSTNYSGIKIGNTGWNNAWVQRNDDTIYFNTQNASGSNRIYMDSTDALINFGSGSFIVNNSGSLTATTGSIAGINLSAGRLFSGPNGNWANANTGFYLDLNGYFSLKNQLYFNPDADFGAGVATFTGALSGASGSVGNNFLIGADCRIGDQLRVNEPQASSVSVAKIRGYRAWNTSDGSAPSTATYSLVLEDKNGINLMYVNDFGNLYSRVAATSSDQRLKTNIQDSNLGLDFIKALKPRRYNLILEEENNIVKRFEFKNRFGFIAQEVKTIADSFVENFGGWMIEDENDEESSQSLSYNDFISPIVKAIQELSAKVDELESRLI